MPYAIELFFDNELEAKIFVMWKNLAKAKITSTMLDIGSRPHLCLAIYEDADLEKLTKLVEDFAKTACSFPVKFGSVGSFDTNERVVILNPAENKELFDLHRDFHKSLPADGFSCHEYYKPGIWLPHCTVAINVEVSKFEKAI